MLAVLGGLADVERDLIRTRTAEGRTRAALPGAGFHGLRCLLINSNLPIRQARRQRIRRSSRSAAAPRTAASNFSLTLDRLNYQFSRKALRI
jgi:DNA invertase Pin-like site-specific DNA recombinase